MVVGPLLSLMVGNALPSVMVWTPVPGMLKAMVSGPEWGLASSIAARRVQAFWEVAQVPSPGLASASSAVESTVKFVAAYTGAMDSTPVNEASTIAPTTVSKRIMRLIFAP